MAKSAHLQEVEEAATRITLRRIREYQEEQEYERAKSTGVQSDEVNTEPADKPVKEGTK